MRSARGEQTMRSATPATIGENVTLGDNLSILGPGVRISDDACIGSDVSLGAGVVIGRGAWIQDCTAVTESVPPFSVLGGTPAKTIGFRQYADKASPSLCEPIGADRGRASQSAAKVQLGVRGCATQRLAEHSDHRGGLIVGEFPNSLPFEPARFFVVKDVPAGSVRGAHAHKACHQFLICLNGSCNAFVDNGMERQVVRLATPGIGLYMPPMTWGSQFGHASDTVLLVLASHAYDANDYVHDYTEFLQLLEQTPA